MSVRLVLGALLLCVFQLAAPPPVSAQGLDADGVSGRVLANRGIDAYTSGEFEAARALLVRSYKKVPAERTLAYLMLVEVQLGLCDVAMKRLAGSHLQRLHPVLARHLREQFAPGTRCVPPDGVSPFEEASLPCDLKLTVTSDPAGAEVWGFLPGEAQGQVYYGTTPLVLDNLCTGAHSITLKKFGHRPQGRTVHLLRGQENTLFLALPAYEKGAFLDRFRKYASVGIDLTLPTGTTEEGDHFGFGDTLAVEAELSLAIQNFWFTGSLGYLPVTVEGKDPLRVLEGKALLEYVWPLLRRLPFATVNSTVLSANIGVGGSVMAWDRWGTGAFVQGGVSLYWLNVTGFYYLGTSFGNDTGIRTMTGLTVGLDFYL